LASSYQLSGYVPLRGSSRIRTAMICKAGSDKYRSNQLVWCRLSAMSFWRDNDTSVFYDTAAIGKGRADRL